jgi:hypothetical protein
MNAKATLVKPEPALPIKTTHAAGRATADDSPVLHAAIGLAKHPRRER